MKTKRLFVLELVLLGGLGMVFLVPKNNQLQPPAVAVSLPEFVGNWYGTDEPISEGERQILGPDTEFARKLYSNGRGDQMYVSIVLSGPDMNTSIHRPERCLPAQGWTIAHSETVTVPTKQGPLRVTRLLDMRPLGGPAGKPRDIYSLTYYWFVGRDETTPSHLYRTFIDIRDRLLKGYNQRWAYITVASVITDGLQPFGLDEKATDAEVEGFIRQLRPLLRKPATASVDS
jgi:EpsI family protein